jgi:hypothetical protein
MSDLKKFLLILSISLIATFLIHIFILNQLDKPLFDNRIIPAYLVNFLLAVVIYLTLFKLKKKYLEQLGFIFMFGSMLKFLVFFIFFYPAYKSDGDIQPIEFTTFFIPYAISLIFETLGVIRFLKK